MKRMHIADCGLRIADFPRMFARFSNPKSEIRNPK